MCLSALRGHALIRHADLPCVITPFPAQEGVDTVTFSWHISQSHLIALHLVALPIAARRNMGANVSRSAIEVVSLLREVVTLLRRIIDLLERPAPLSRGPALSTIGSSETEPFRDPAVPSRPSEPFWPDQLACSLERYPLNADGMMNSPFTAADEIPTSITLLPRPRLFVPLRPRSWPFRIGTARDPEDSRNDLDPTFQSSPSRSSQGGPPSNLSYPSYVDRGSDPTPPSWMPLSPSFQRRFLLPLRAISDGSETSPRNLGDFDIPDQHLEDIDLSSPPHEYPLDPDGSDAGTMESPFDSEGGVNRRYFVRDE